MWVLGGMFPDFAADSIIFLLKSDPLLVYFCFNWRASLILLVTVHETLKEDLSFLPPLYPSSGDVFSLYVQPFLSISDVATLAQAACSMDIIS